MGNEGVSLISVRVRGHEGHVTRAPVNVEWSWVARSKLASAPPSMDTCLLCYVLRLFLHRLRHEL